MSEKQQVLYQNLFKKLKRSTNGESESNFYMAQFSASHIMFSMS